MTTSTQCWWYFLKELDVTLSIFPRGCLGVRSRSSSHHVRPDMENWLERLQLQWVGEPLLHTHTHTTSIILILVITISVKQTIETRSRMQHLIYSTWFFGIMISYHDDDDDDIFLLPSSAPLALVKGPCAPYFTIEACHIVTCQSANLPCKVLNCRTLSCEFFISALLSPLLLWKKCKQDF